MFTIGSPVDLRKLPGPKGGHPSTAYASSSFDLVARNGGGHVSEVQMQIDYPDSLPDLLQTTRPEFEAEARMAMAVKLFELKRLSSGLAARMAGDSRVEFLMNLHRYGVPVIAHDETELASDVAHA